MLRIICSEADLQTFLLAQSPASGPHITSGTCANRLHAAMLQLQTCPNCLALFLVYDADPTQNVSPGLSAFTSRPQIHVLKQGSYDFKHLEQISNTFSLRPLVATMRSSCARIKPCRALSNWRYCVNALTMRAATWNMVVGTEGRQSLGMSHEYKRLLSGIGSRRELRPCLGSQVRE